jgi:hypothetical protein
MLLSEILDTIIDCQDLLEILDSNVGTKVVTDNATNFVVTATINGREIEFQAFKVTKIEDRNVWQVSFAEVQSKDGKEIRTYGKTSSGGELEVFSMVKNGMRELITKHHPDEMIFTANKDGGKNNQARGDVYERLIKRFKVPGYELNREEKTQTVNNGKFKQNSQRSYDHFSLVKV